MTTAPRLLVVDLAAVQTELDSLRDDYVDRKRKEAADDAMRAMGRADWERCNDLAVDAWATAFPALELLRDEIK